ncbi:hypothetical protein MNBD_GAMMA26-230 [hydrothermal vent metagenome]|uniref:NnrS protein involved in response to NO n=1 Tax=hydrothermal vent metagenome TaxID=652676 RepID=A0A3B1AKT5_9ZZZZ
MRINVAQLSDWALLDMNVALAKLMAALAITALLSCLLGLLLPHFLALPPAASLHMILALGIMPLILGAMLYFIPVLTRTGNPEHSILLSPLAALAAGAIAALSLALTYQLYPLATAIALLAVGGLLWWSRGRAQATLGRPHPGLLWYQLAMGALALGLAAITLAAYWPEQWLPLKRFHLHLNILGFVGLAALGTLRVLLPTVGGFQDPQTGPWLMQTWRWLVAGTLLIGVGAGWLPLLAEIGMLLWLIVLVRLAHSLLLTHCRSIWNWHGAATPLATSIIGLLLCLTGGALHGYGLLPTAQASEAFVIAFLLPLVTGATTHLLPLWLLQNQPPANQQALRTHLGRFSGIRSIVFILGGILSLVGYPWGYILGILALGHFLLLLAAS